MNTYPAIRRRTGSTIEAPERAAGRSRRTASALHPPLQTLNPIAHMISESIQVIDLNTPPPRWTVLVALALIAVSSATLMLGVSVSEGGAPLYSFAAQCR